MDVPPGFGPILRLVVGLRRPRHPVMGSEFVGRIEVLGPGVTGWSEGDRVMGLCGMQGGAHAEALTIRADGLVVRAPDTLTDEEAAGFFFGGLTAAHYLLDKAGLEPGERVLVNGATGAVGSAAVQIARHHGAHVTAVCGAANAGLARELGAEAVLDYRADDLTGRWDVVLDVVGTLPWPTGKTLLAPDGRLVAVTPSLGQMLGAAVRPRRGGQRVAAGVMPETRGAMERLLAIHTGGGYRPVIGAALPFERIVDAHRLAGSGHKRGNVVVTMTAQRPS
jgi:NADPH:quinone reductase-like Zn-dependent oxidoreductase